MTDLPTVGGDGTAPSHPPGAVPGADADAAGAAVRPSRRRAGVRGRARGRGPLGRLPPRWRVAARVALAGFAGLCVVLGALVAYAAATLPSIDTIGRSTGTVKLLDVHGQPIGEYGLGDSQQRTTVALDRVAPVLRDATIATEDRNFYGEGAFNFGRIAKALFVDVIARRPSQGASTITQQLAKLAFFGSNADRSPLRKLREALLADEIDRKYSKDQILEKYLNLIYYGHGAYGIEDASETYFGKHAVELDVREASLLAGLPQAPADYDPYQSADAAFARQHTVLASMIDAGKLPAAQADQVDPTTGDPAAQQAKRQATIDDLKHGHRTAAAGVAAHFVEYVKEQLQAQFSDDPAALSGTVTVTTSLDLSVQRKAEDAVAKGVAAIGSGANNGALLMLDSHTGNILAMVGSADFANDAIAGQYNVVTGQRRPGSSFKPYVYEEGFKNGSLKPDTILDDTPQESQKLGGVMDFDRSFLGRISASRSLLESRNVYTEEAMLGAGTANVIDFAHQLGITSDLADNASTAIGTSAVRMIDHAAAYAAFSNGGTTVTPRSILRVTDERGTTLFDAGQPSGGRQVMTAAQAYSVTKILRGYAQRWNLRFSHPTAGKSGTTDNFVDAWYMTYSPDWVVASWAGHTESANSAEIPMDGVFGTTVGQQVSVRFVNSLTDEVPFRDFTPVNGSLSDCSSADASASALAPAREGCASPTPSPSPSPTPTPSPSPPPTATPTATPAVVPTTLPTLAPTVPVPTVAPPRSPTPSPSASP